MLDSVTGEKVSMARQGGMVWLPSLSSCFLSLYRRRGCGLATEKDNGSQLAHTSAVTRMADRFKLRLAATMARPVTAGMAAATVVGIAGMVVTAAEETAAAVTRLSGSRPIPEQLDRGWNLNVVSGC